MTATEHVPSFGPTLDDMKALVEFVRARAGDLRDRARLNSDEDRTANALIDVASVMLGVAQSEASHGDGIGTAFFAVAVAAGRWSDHPDFRPAWRR